MTPQNPRGTFGFHDFELDIAAYELRRRGRRVRLERRPMDLLILLVERPGELVTRTEIVERLWSRDVFIEVESAVNTLVRKIRLALGDSSEAPTFIETVPGKGYRFIAKVEIVPTRAAAASSHAARENGAAASVPQHASAVDVRATTIHAAGPVTRRRVSVLIGLLALLTIAALGAWAWIGSRPVTLAVLPFDVINMPAERAYLADALHDDTITSLGRTDPGQLRVIGRTSMLQYKGTKKSVSQIGQELRVKYVVETSIRMENNRLRITPKLIAVRDQTHVWSKAYDSEPGNMLEFQREFSAAIAEQIRLRVSPERMTGLARRQTDNPEAYDLYLQGLFYWNQLKPDLSTTQRAVEFFTRATKLDPQYALAWAGIAVALGGAPIHGDAPPRAISPRAHDAADRAVRADPTLAETQTAVGMVQFWLDWDWTNAEAAFRKAVDIDPNYPLAQRMVGIVLSHERRHAEARERMRRLRELEWDYAMNHALSAQVAFNARDFPAALEFARQATVMDFWVGYYQLGMVAEQLTRYDLALEQVEKALAAGFSNSKLHALRGYTLAKMGRPTEAGEVLRLLQTMSNNKEKYVPPYALALVNAGLGQRDAVFESLERALVDRDVHLVALPTDAKWDAYRTDPRFISLLKRCGFPNAD